MEGLIPFLYKAFVMYKRERRFSSILFNDHHSPSTAGYYTRLLEDSSASSGPSDQISGGWDQAVLEYWKRSRLPLDKEQHKVSA
ncbi:hypothetical protein Bca101_015773 [Brassica carinata]